MKKISAKSIWSVFKQSFKGFSDDKVPKLSASLAYYTVFSLGPLLIVLIFLSSIFFGREAIEGSIYGQIKGFVGNDAAAEIQSMVANASIGGKSKLSAVIGIITLIIGATTVFGEIQDSINSIWGLRAKAKAGIWKLIKDRLLSFGIIGSLGFLLLVSLAITSVVEALNKRLAHIFPDVTVIIFYIINLVITLAVVSILFAVIFKVLPDAKIKWRDVWAGSIATGVLFMLGKFAIALYVSKSSVASTYGAAGSFVVLLVWIYYSSFILYFGAEFTKAWAIKYGSEIRPSDYAVLIKKVEVESASGSVQENHEDTQAHQEKLQQKEDIKAGKEPAPTRPKATASAVPPPRPAPQAYMAPPKNDKPKSTPLLMALGGLLLYFINSHSKTKGRW